MDETPSKDELRRLAHKWKTGTLTKEEEQYLAEWDNRQRDELLHLPDNSGGPEAVRERMFTNLFNVINPENKKPAIVRLWPRIAVAASVLVAVSIGGYQLLHQHRPVKQVAQNDILPGGNKAILISHGKQYSITDAKNGLIATQGNTSINKTADGKLTYSGKSNGSMVYDTLIVPRGGQHQLTLADGTVAYLNADTKIRYPESFSGKERDVELISGELILQVKHNAAMPFKLLVKGQEVRDFGTEFDVSAYDDEPGVRTTLISGVVKVGSSNQTSRTLKPGQQAFGQDNSLTVKDVDLDVVTAWQKGMFRYDGTSLETIMKQISRWYNVDVVYQDNALKTQPFTVISTRFANVSQVLHDLEQIGVLKFKIDGRKIIVMDK